jgi:hypothetical protein
LSCISIVFVRGKGKRLGYSGIHFLNHKTLSRIIIRSRCPFSRTLLASDLFHSPALERVLAINQKICRREGSCRGTPPTMVKLLMLCQFLSLLLSSRYDRYSRRNKSCCYNDSYRCSESYRRKAFVVIKTSISFLILLWQ